MLYPLGLGCVFLIIAISIKGNVKWVKVFCLWALILLWFGGNSWVSVSIRRTLEWQYLPPDQLPEVDAVVVLGGATEPVQYPRRLVEMNSAGDRMVYAGFLYHQGVAPKLLLSGSYIPWLSETDSSPAEDMGTILMMLGVPEEAIWFEIESRNTYENAVNSAAILKQHDIRRIVLVTSAAHMPRAVDLFEKQNLEVIPAPTDYTVTQAVWEQLWSPNLLTQLLNFLPNASDLAGTTSAIKEYLGILVYKFRGWL
jgi:uncharacterized SAM-binding protein YcdF (DUF218 family)